MYHCRTRDRIVGLEWHGEITLYPVGTGMSGRRLQGMTWTSALRIKYVSGFIPEPLLLQGTAYHHHRCIELHCIAHSRAKGAESVEGEWN